MTRDEWMKCDDPDALLEAFSLSERKGRLLAVACCRRIWKHLRDGPSRRAVETAERFADGLATREELRAAASATYGKARGAPPSAKGPPAPWGAAVPVQAPWVLKAVLEGARAYCGRGREDEERKAQADLVRDMQNPWAPTLPLSVFRWNDHLVYQLARRIYERRDFGSLPVLGDALEEAGLTEAEFLHHLRSPGPHYPGCWALDAVLGLD